MFKFKKIMAISAILLVYFLYLPYVNALNSCLNNVTLQKNITLQVGSGSADNIIVTKECEFGCDSVTKECSPNPFYAILFFIGFLICVIVAAFFIYNKVK